MDTDLVSAKFEFELELVEAHANFLSTTGIVLSFMGPFALSRFLIQAFFDGVILGAIGAAIGIGAMLTSDELRKRIQQARTLRTTCACDATGAASATCDFAGQCNCNTGYTGTECNQCDTSFYSSGGVCQGKEFYSTDNIL